MMTMASTNGIGWRGSARDQFAGSGCSRLSLTSGALSVLGEARSLVQAPTRREARSGVTARLKGSYRPDAKPGLGAKGPRDAAGSQLPSLLQVELVSDEV
jgi:hypothetical protein